MKLRFYLNKTTTEHAQRPYEHEDLFGGVEVTMDGNIDICHLIVKAMEETFDKSKGWESS